MTANEIKATLKLIEKKLLVAYEGILNTPIREDVMPEGDYVTRQYLNSLPRNEIENKKRYIDTLLAHVDSLYAQEDQYRDLHSFMESCFSRDSIEYITSLIPYLGKKDAKEC